MPDDSRREAESLPHFIELEMPTSFNHEGSSASSRNCRAGFPACASRNRQRCLLDEKGAMPVLQPRRRGETSPRERVSVTAVRQLLLHLVLFLFPRPNQNRTIVFPDIGIVEARF